MKLKEFLSRSEEIVRAQASEPELLRRLGSLVRALVRGPDGIPEAAFTPRNDRFANNLIYRPSDKRFSVNEAVWLPGQTTPIHDHLTWAVVGVLRGEEKESIFRRTDDPSDSTRATLKRVSETVNRPGHVTVLTHRGIHRIDNASSRPTLSVHVYGSDIGNAERHSYDPVTGAIGTFVSGYCIALRDLDDD